MSKQYHWTMAIAGFVLGAAALGQPVAAQEPPAEPTPVAAMAPAAVSEPAKSDGFWPSQRQMELMFVRWADEAVVKYDLDADQTRQVNEAVRERWPTFMKEHRADLQPLLNDWFEMRLELTPPTEEQVQDWAKRAQPMFEAFRTEFQEGAQEFREVLRPMQRVKFELELMQFGLGMQIAQAKLSQWQQGEYQEHEFWDAPPTVRRARREAREAERNGGAAVPESPPDQVAAELGRWDRFVEQFIKMYDLDDTQQATARSLLGEMKERAAAHRDRHRARIDQLELRIMQGKDGDDELAEIKQELVELYGPIDEMFAELKRRLEAIPTTVQRERVGQTKLEAQQAEREERRQARERQRAEAEAKAAEEAGDDD